MALKKLLTNLEQGIQMYPNHNTPSTSGGFNYGSSTTRIFDNLPFRQKSFTFGQGTAYDRPLGQFSSEPFITNPIYNALRNNPSIDNLPGDANSGVPNSLIRGGAATHVNRQLDDFNRITNFLITPKGIAFTLKQIGLQRSNPRIDKPSNSVESSGGIINFLGSAASSLLGSVANQRTYNLNGNLLAQVAVTGTGIHVKREGLLPTARGGYKDADGTGLLGGPNLFEDGPKNRLIYLLQDKIYTTTGSDLTSNENQSGIGRFLSSASKFVKKAGEFLGNKNNDLGTLYSYSGGPESLYGIGRTTIRRYTATNKDSLPRVGDDGQFDSPLLTNSPNIQNYLLKLGKPGYNYTRRTEDDSNPRYFIREERINTGNPGVGVGRDNERSDQHIQQKNSDGSLNYNVYNLSRVDKVNLLDVFRAEGKATVGQARDLIRFRFEAVDSDNPNFSDFIIFRAFLDDFKDNYNATHNEFNYNGRGETFYTYNSFKRNISLSFKIAAQSRVEMMPLYRKLNYLVSNVAPEYGSNGRIRTPFIKLTVGSWCDRVPGVLNSVNLSWQKDYPWEISLDGPEKGLSMDKHMVVLPHVLDVSVEFTPVHNFLPQKSIHAPFILPHVDNRDLDSLQQYYKPGIAESAADALKLGIEKLGDINHMKDTSKAIPATGNGSDNSTTGEDGKKTPIKDFFNNSFSRGKSLFSNNKL